MNALKQILKWTLIFLLSFTTFNFFISGKIEVSIEIEAPVVIVYEKVTDLQTWPTWAPWWKNARRDPSRALQRSTCWSRSARGVSSPA